MDNNQPENTDKNGNGDWRNPDGTFGKGNPGRPKGARSFTSKVREALEKVAEGKNTTYEEMLVKSLLHKAISEQDSATIKLIWNYLDGMPDQNFGIGGRDGEALKIEFADAFKKDVNTPPATN